MRYYTFKKDVPLEPGQIVHWTKGHGYWAGPPSNKPIPKPHPKPHPLTPAQLMVHWATWGMVNMAHFVYTQGPQRAQMFNTLPGTIPEAGMHADCSQFYAACGHWAGVAGFTDLDYTGTLLEKGRASTIAEAQPAYGVVFGPETGTHIAMWTERISAEDGWLIGFGHSPGAPNRVQLSVLAAYFRAVNKPGIRVLAFT